ncbi:hypothetical protein RIF23_18890 [Lipingzhangella sp. LS1_29]|uniref:Uncharacterized protein n=1 Tax=Lipingzhangella rawalii TaxID=2055835 RepID=A0ABU2HAS7_9ACTN|nr:hypothetical protein [Lipingzhangella rawalii]MDS1272358.1 hypothetical protein [Lipingzhangella rawalii]
MADRPTAATPRWVRVSGVILGVLILLAVLVLVSSGGLGQHGPARHTSQGALHAWTEPASPDHGGLLPDGRT